jgi:hypothetical protein
MQIKTAELMIQNYNLKLGALALAQESVKGFDKGIPAVAHPYMESIGFSPEEMVKTEAPTSGQPQKYRTGGQYIPNFYPHGGPHLSGAFSKPFQRTIVDPDTQLDPYALDDFGGFETRDWSMGMFDEESAFTLGNERPSFAKTKVKPKTKMDGIGIAGQLLGPGIDAAASIGDWYTRQKFDIADMTPSDRNFNPIGVDQGDHGFNAYGLSMDPNEYTPVQHTGMAQYGGQPSFKRGGSTKKIRVTKVPRYDVGGSNTPTTSSRATRIQNIPKGSVKWDPTKPEYDPGSVQKGDYILQDGVWKKVTGYARPKYTGDNADDRLGRYANDFGEFYDAFEANDGEIRKLYIEQYRKEIAKAKPNTATGLTQADIDDAANLDDEQVINIFYEKQRMNLAVNDKYGDLSEYDKKDKWDSDRKLAGEAATSVGFDSSIYDSLNKVHVAAFQAGYIGLKNLFSSDEHKDKFKKYQLAQTGLGDEQISGTGKGTISQIDGYDGNTTSGEFIYSKDSEMTTEDVPYEDVEGTEGLAYPLNRRTPAKYWTEDLMDIGKNLSNVFRAKKYDPWIKKGDYVGTNPSFVDFRGAAARIASGAQGMGRVGLNMMAPSGARTSMLSNLQAKTLPGIFGVQEAEHKINTGIANRYRDVDARRRTKYNEYTADIDTKLQRQYDIADQQFRNSKTQLWALTLDSVKNAWTNKGKTATMNLLRPDYAVDPRTGYLLSDPSLRPITADAIDPYSTAKELAKIKGLIPGISDTDAIRIIKIDKGLPDYNYAAGIDPAAYEGSVAYEGYPGQTSQ